MNARAYPILESIGGIGEDLILDAESARPRKKQAVLLRLRRFAAVAACLTLVLAGAFTVIDRLGFFRAGCSAWPGTIVDGAYYYTVAHSGAWRYTPEGGNVKVRGAFWMDGWLVNEHGFFYCSTFGRSVYRLDPETGKIKRLYTAGLQDSTHIGFSLPADGNPIVTVYNKRAETLYEVRVDGVDGGVLETVTPTVSYEDWWRDLSLPYSNSHFTVGERELALALARDDEYVERYDVLENGASILPEGTLTAGYGQRYENGVAFPLYPADDDGPYEEPELLLARPGGDDVILPRQFLAGWGDWMFYTSGSTANSPDDSIWCYDVNTGEEWRLENDTEWEFYELTTDGEYLYSCVPWGDAHTLWRLVWEDGRPAGLELLDEDITK